MRGVRHGEQGGAKSRLRRRLLISLRKSRRYICDSTHALRIHVVELATPLRAITAAA